MIRRGIVSILISLLICAFGIAEPKRVAVFIDSPTGTGGDELAGAIDETISYYLGISGEYTLISFDDLPAGVSGENLEEAAKTYNLDQVVFAAVPADDDGAAVTVKVFDSEAGKNIYENTTDTVAGRSSSGAARILMEPVVDKLLDVKNTWGTVEIAPRGAEGSYSVEINNIAAGRNVRDNLWVPAGTYVVEALQVRPFGTQILLEEKATVRRGAGARLSFAIPELTDLERTAFEEIDKKILDAWDSDATVVREQLELVADLFEGIKASDTLEQFKSKYRTWDDEYKAGQKASDISIVEKTNDSARREIAAKIEQDLHVDDTHPEEVIAEQVEPIIISAPRTNLGGVILAATGPLLQRLGGVARTMAHESIFKREDAPSLPPTYNNVTYNFETADSVLYWSNLGLYGGSAIVESFAYPFQTYTLSPWGKAVYSAGVVFDALGNTFSVMSQYLRALNARIEYQYSIAEPWDIWHIGENLDESYDAYAGMRISSFAAWTLGTAASVIAPYIGGPRTTAISGSGRRMLHYAGPFLTALGNLASIVSYNARLLVDERSDAYYNADFATGDDYYGAYENAYAFYFWSTIGTYSFWGLGALSSILAVVLPDRRTGGSEQPATKPRPAPLFTVEPRAGGLYAGVRMAM